jgi:carboxypeptidase Taq
MIIVNDSIRLPAAKITQENMPENPQKKFEEYLQKMRVLRAFGSAESLLSWDRETHLPAGASNERGQTMAILAGFAHQLTTDPQFVKLVDELYEQRAVLGELERRSIELCKKSLDKSVKLPTQFIEETEAVLNNAHAAWLEAKKNDTYHTYAPLLAKVIENRKRYAAYINPSADPYDVSLDDYEEGLTTADLTPLFAELRKGITDLLPQIMKKQAAVGEAKNPVDGVELNQPRLQQFIKEMLGQIGYDWNRGAMGSVEHPFEITISPNDVRLNTKYEKFDNSFTLTGMVHELGHGLYEQNVASQYTEKDLGNGVSLGIHESQSRLLENIIGRSTFFWQYFFPKLQQAFPEVAQLQSATVDDVVRSLNVVKPSLIRTESDEVTYNLHIIVRFELEKAVMRNELAVQDLPEAWRAKMKELLGVAPSTDREGVMQDVHWSWGNFGYFPTYTLGNLNAAQLWSSFVKGHANWQTDIAAGNFSAYTSWFKEHIWQYGSFYKPEELMKRATGESTNAKYFLSYLRDKYLT